VDPTDFAAWPPLRLLWFLAITGVFFYRSFPKPEWKWYVGLPVYWLYVLLFYFGYAGTMSAGLVDFFKDRVLRPADIEGPVTITSLILLLFFRYFSRYSRADESTEWAAEFIKGILLSRHLRPVLRFLAVHHQHTTARKFQPIVGRVCDAGGVRGSRLRDVVERSRHACACAGR